LAQQVRIIGRGTWLDKVADEVIQREKGLGRNLSLIRVESGIAASGIPHLGSVGDAIRSYGVKLALEGLGYNSELIAFSDDLDGLRRVPQGYPASLEDYLAHPVTRIPDAFGCHSSFAEHTSALLRDALDKIGIEYRFMSGAQTYKSGILNEQIKKILSNAEVIGRKIRELTGQEKYEKIIPYTPICKNCGRLYTTVAGSFDKEKGIVHYKCGSAEIREKLIQGCGFEGEARIEEGEGKLVWKSEFAARWAALDIRFEAYGKDIADSVKVNDWICEHILAYAPPYHARYELFQDKSGKKIAKSTGNVITPQDWLAYASPESLRLLMFKRIVGARSISIDDVPTYMNEFDELEEYYFSKSKDHNLMKDAKLRGLYEYSMLLKVPDKPRPHVPYRLLAELAPSAPSDGVKDFVMKRLIAYGMMKEISPELLARIRWAAEWSKRGITIESKPIELDPKISAALEEFANRLIKCKSADEIQSAAFESLRANELEPQAFFPSIYRILIGAAKGPRLGPYIFDLGINNASERIKSAIASARHN
jgi:lysyl-tRNA synthetase class 1